MFAVYPPIYMVQTLGPDRGTLWGAAVVSVGNGLLFGAPLAGRLAARTGLRLPITGAFVGMGVLTFSAGLLHAWPGAVVACLLTVIYVLWANRAYDAAVARLRARLGR